VEECSRQGLTLMTLDDALARSEPRALAEDGADWPTSWGAGNDLSTWSGSCAEVAETAFRSRASELALLRAGRDAGAAAVRELLALQSSDWAFMLTRGLAAPYARERFEGHHAGLRAALAAGPRAGTDHLRRLALHADPALLLEP
jgi:1,4-alpha-glucan branching enzyme